MTKVVIYTSLMCGYCVRAKNLFIQKNIKFKEINIYENTDKKDEMIKLSGGMLTVPQIFIEDNHICGWDDLSELNNSGKLDNMISFEE